MMYELLYIEEKEVIRDNKITVELVENVKHSR